MLLIPYARNRLDFHICTPPLPDVLNIESLFDITFVYIFELFDLSVSPMSPISDDGNIRNWGSFFSPSIYHNFLPRHMKAQFPIGCKEDFFSQFIKDIHTWKKKAWKENLIHFQFSPDYSCDDMLDNVSLQSPYEVIVMYSRRWKALWHFISLLNIKGERPLNRIIDYRWHS